MKLEVPARWSLIVVASKVVRTSFEAERNLLLGVFSSQVTAVVTRDPVPYPIRSRRCWVLRPKESLIPAVFFFFAAEDMRERQQQAFKAIRSDVMNTTQLLGELSPRSRQRVMLRGAAVQQQSVPTFFFFVFFSVLFVAFVGLSLL